MPGLDKPEAQVLGLINKVYWVDVASGALAAHLAIALEPVKIVSGRFLTVDGKPLKGTVAIQSALNRSRVGLDGRFRIPVPENRAEYVYFVAHGYPVKSLHVDPLAEDRDFGDIEVSERNGDSVVSITLSQADQTDHRIDNKGSGVSLVSVNGNTVLTFVAKETSKGTQVFANTGTEDMPHVPEGTYYATPGLFGNSLSYLVLDAVRAGRTDELDKAGVPKIVAVPGKVSELTINVPQADVAISALPERGSTGSKPAAPKAPK
jgi:hypothetical protein